MDKKKQMYAIYNKTDQHFASQESFTKPQANEWIKEFPKRYEKQGYYRSAEGNKIDAKEVIFTLTPIKD